MCTLRSSWKSQVHALTTCLEKTAKQTTDIILYDQKVIVFKMESDVMLYVVGGPEENEVLLYRYDQLKKIIREWPEKLPNKSPLILASCSLYGIPLTFSSSTQLNLRFTDTH